ncbi:inositol phospholipid synthesis and fat-storage-inducing TM-domain-containing protein [Infundibulicybe gibba]|nr:inositol phospholipid synthesis and fat-storage-inducing TM-domain-containing protein [Infundibulicybe gibba]
MPDSRINALVIISATVLLGTGYSIINHTYLDTSDPLLTNLPHPLHATHYFASKSNPLNVYFIKRAWGWTSAVFLFSFFTSPSNTRTASRMLKWIVETVVWLAFTSWFFGPALIERVILASGGECSLTLPSGGTVSVPEQFCIEKSIVSPQTHPNLFATPFMLPTGWGGGRPRLRSGHDVSGHVFLLAMSVLFLVDQLRYTRVGQSSGWHTIARVTTYSLICMWIVAICTTSIYFHSPFEKITGLLLGICGFGVSQLEIFK